MPLISFDKMVEISIFSQQVVYYMDKDVYEVPAYSEICEEKVNETYVNLVCCSCYVYFKAVDNCLSKYYTQYNHRSTCTCAINVSLHVHIVTIVESQSDYKTA